MHWNRNFAVTRLWLLPIRGSHWRLLKMLRVRHSAAGLSPYIVLPSFAITIDMITHAVLPESLPVWHPGATPYATVERPAKPGCRNHCTGNRGSPYKSQRPWPALGHPSYILPNLSPRCVDRFVSRNTNSKVVVHDHCFVMPFCCQIEAPMQSISHLSILLLTGGSPGVHLHCPCSSPNRQPRSPICSGLNRNEGFTVTRHRYFSIGMH
ncbi:hypothetical protein AUEXF2481DRAFT_479023 [Aureobasidium subglaciale EXF-2481]|uniref:Uncharacterized protein n=1 Tax=Aureobasidium subglaciale (strain EXF-2481) TaxID=1043005 RepID=A0A074YKH0_AURSE|nr:uncharacterized protein AUEXF2481DRAFT_479023 [Aureobasidium subglaciale EXF-2481]KEQ98323.1 hypothetical protein AUEXF2481DRAFT_479023 [Aureobasidium subglaciale EXF-2481]